MRFLFSSKFCGLKYMWAKNMRSYQVNLKECNDKYSLCLLASLDFPTVFVYVWYIRCSKNIMFSAGLEYISLVVNVQFFSVSRLVFGDFEQRGCVHIWRSSAVLCWDSEVPLRKQCNPQTPFGQELHWCSSKTHPEALHSRWHQLHYSGPHSCTGVSRI